LSKTNLKLLGLHVLWMMGALMLMELAFEVSAWFGAAFLVLWVTLAAQSYRVR